MRFNPNGLGDSSFSFLFAMGIGLIVGLIVGSILSSITDKPSCKIVDSGIYAGVNYLRSSGCSNKSETIITWQDGSTTVLRGIIPVDMKTGETYSIVQYSHETPKFELPEKACILDLR